MNEKRCGIQRGGRATTLLGGRPYAEIEKGGLVLSRDLRVNEFKVLVLIEDDFVQDKRE